MVVMRRGGVPPRQISRRQPSDLSRFISLSRLSFPFPIGISVDGAAVMSYSHRSLQVSLYFSLYSLSLSSFLFQSLLVRSLSVGIRRQVVTGRKPTA